MRCGAQEAWRHRNDRAPAAVGFHLRDDWHADHHDISRSAELKAAILGKVTVQTEPARQCTESRRSTFHSMVATGNVIIVDQDEGARGTLAQYLTASGFAVRAFGSAESFLERPPTGPACVVVDHYLPGLSGPELQKQLGDSALAIVFVAAGGDVPTVVKAMKGGAVDFLTKPVDTQQLVAAVTRGLERSARTEVVRRRHHALVERVGRLTRRECQVAAGLIRGMSNKEIAAELGTAEKTVKVQRAHVMCKLEVSSVAELVRMVEYEGRAIVSQVLASRYDGALDHRALIRESPDSFFGASA